jgi:hypothetical protein
MGRELKLFVHADYFGERCRAAFRSEGLDPDYGYICAVITFPDESMESPVNLLQAARFAEGEKEGQPIWVDPERQKSPGGRVRIEDSFTTHDDKKVRFLVGLSEPLK